ncbi:RimJ/RimL family protein N-acetyltransferase [Bifidobacterium aemilianum]|uniref:RimJ/RimL family protein N-acetyltransferase n=2 Tax=Bifidobacterium aemilianum TaxID=2493120 RepID=A0A366K6K4_9BIFI|nr:RimJ/RimL family protein N-acetyltransferase [Bifidobacterium aemilianum]
MPGLPEQSQSPAASDQVADESGLQTERLLLRPWRIGNADDVQDLYRYAQDPEIGPSAGWAVHRSVQESAEVIDQVLARPESYALVLKETGHIVGSMSFKTPSNTVWPDGCTPDRTMGIGYWIGRPYWGQGLAVEAAKELLRHGFEDLGLSDIYGVHDVENHKSERVMDKLGMEWVRIAEHVRLPLLPGEVYRDQAIRCLIRRQWESRQS